MKLLVAQKSEKKLPSANYQLLKKNCSSSRCSITIFFVFILYITLKVIQFTLLEFCIFFGLRNLSRLWSCTCYCLHSRRQHIAEPLSYNNETCPDIYKQVCMQVKKQLSHLINTPTNAHTYNFYIKTFKISPTCFDPKIIFRELRCSLLKSHF